MAENGTSSVDETREKSRLRKIDIHLMVPLWVIFVFGFLDRINLGNISVLGIMPELRMTGTEMTIAMQIYFVPYILTDIPSNIILKIFASSTWISALSFFWGLVEGAFGGLLAFALYHMHGLGGYSGWRWIFIIEGLLSIVFAMPVKFIIADWPEHAKFLSEDEKQLLRERNSRDDGGGARMDRLDGPAWKRIMSDWKLYVGSLIYLPLVTPQPFLSPLLSNPLGGLNVHVRYMAVFIVTTGCYIVQPVAIVWMANNLSGHYKRAIGLAIQIGLGNLGGIVASNIFNSDAAPRYTVGYSVSLAMVVLCGIMGTVFAAGLAIENKKRDQGQRDYRFQLDETIRNNLGDDDPTFRFSL
ncbi:predicted protein [Aspergillus terreus NIH2624]|uniref:Major facilitator superfamily (MFS) profile domain-containing protein n=1 Tax=Aspergillus terreus (strain NIH 2624 / FGSC A1156) TaxID=341663 RepID=Q0CHT0_ASPTN|nr:uncharacterized protein ATEG_06754 [Aspergillus terreus NIH2624]EAU33298.1 predicted protein [Aspergillus terreus NIH2624]